MLVLLMKTEEHKTRVLFSSMWYLNSQGMYRTEHFHTNLIAFILI